MAVLARSLRLLRTVCLLVATVVMPAWTGYAYSQDATAELQIKAAFLHKFATYVEGAGTAFSEAGTPLVYGVAGSDGIYQYLAELVAAQGDAGRPAEVRRVTTAADLEGLHVLFVGQGAAPDATPLLAQAVATSILTVTDMTGPQPPDSMINFFVADDRVRFDVALAPAEAAGLRLSSRLLQVARQVTQSQ